MNVVKLSRIKSIAVAKLHDHVKCRHISLKGQDYVFFFAKTELPSAVNSIAMLNIPEYQLTDTDWGTYDGSQHGKDSINILKKHK